MNVGFVGLGKMGCGVCANIIGGGYNVTVYDIVPQNMDKFREKAALAESPEALFQKCDVTFLSLPGFAEIEGITDLFLRIGTQGKTVVDLSTNHPASTRKIYEKFKAAGGAYLDAPLTGTPAHAAEGALAVNVGGDEEDFNRVKEIIDTFSRGTHYIGASGGGNIVKLVNNYLSISINALCAEAFTMVESLGYDVKRVGHIIEDSGVNSAAYRGGYMNVANKDFQHGFTIDYCIKDLSYFKLLFDEIKAPSLLLDGCLNLYKLAHQMGLGNNGASEVVKAAMNNIGMDIERQNV